MKKVLALILVLAVVSCSLDFPLNLIPHIGEIKDVETPRFSINLDDEPKHRWDHIVPTFKVAIQKFVRLIDFINIPNSVFTGLALFAETQASYREYVQELKGIAKIAEVDWKKLLLSNFLYDVSAVLPHANFCSSLVVLQKDGTCLHGRNLDFWPWGLLSKDSAIIDVYQGGEHVATFHQPIGAVMVLSGVRVGSFSVTVDTRKYEIDGENNLKVIETLVDNIILKRYVPSTFLTRNLLQTKGITYEQAVEGFKNTDTTATIYYVVGGINAGCIIEKNPVGYNGFYQIGPNGNGPADQWYLVQTNYDRDEDPGLDDRKTPAEKRLDSIGKNRITLDLLHEEVMNQYPTLNIASIYTSMIYPKTGRNDLTLLYGNIDDIRQSSNLMDSETTIFSDSLKEIVDQHQTLPEEEFNHFIEYFNKTILKWVATEYNGEIAE